MKPKLLVILTAVMAVLGAIAFIASRSTGGGDQTDATELRGKELLEGWAINDVKEIHIQSTDGEVTLKKPDNQWLVADRKDYPADSSKVNTMLVKLWDTPIVQAFEAGKSQDSRLELVDPSGEGDDEKMATKVTFKSGGSDEIGHLLVGKNNPPQAAPGANPMAGAGGKTGRFLRTSKNSDLVLEVADNFSELMSGSGWPYNFGSIEAEPGGWLNKTDFIKVNKPKSIAVTYKDGEKEGYALMRESDTGDYKLEGDIPEGKVLDGSKVSSLKTVLSSASFEDLLTEEEVAEVDESKATEVAITTFEGFTYNILIGPKDEEGNQIPIKFTVAGEFPQERVVEEGKEETEEEKAKADGDFLLEKKKLEDKLALEKALEGHWFALSSYRVDSLLKSRPDLLKDEEEETEEDTEAPPTSLQKPELPPGVTPPTSATETKTDVEVVSKPVAVPPVKKPVTATSPPIEIPAAPEKKEPITATTPPIAIPPRPTEAAEEATEAVEEATEAVKDAVEDSAEAVKETAQDAVDAVKEAVDEATTEEAPEE